jgi:trehalose 6-phosphate synthase/phosphatase
MPMQRQRWITVSNRLPFSVSTDGNQISTSSGGLVSALNGVRTKSERLWIGASPDGLTHDRWPEVSRRLNNTQWRFHPVFAPQNLYEAYYNRFCNDVLWPLLHYHGELVRFETEAWESYQKMNQLFALELIKIARPDDLVWIHDFHLFLLARELRLLRPELRIGFFLHVPFPSSEIFRQLPVREEILFSLLECDLIGFHDYAYLQHFQNAVQRVLGLESHFLSITRKERVTRLGIFPVGIDTSDFIRRSAQPKIQALEKEIRQNEFLFLGVDRLDYMKGIDLKLKAFRHLLRENPEYRGHTTLLQVAVPTRSAVPAYSDLARETACLVGEINGEFSTPKWTPIQYIHASVSSDQLLALYRAADALIVSSKRDGMNLVALEYIASQDPTDPGVVLLSEFAGAISALSHTLAINPWDIEDSANKMKLAVTMSDQEKICRMNTMQSYIKSYTSTEWAISFMAELSRPVPERLQKDPPRLDLSDISIHTVCNRLLAPEPKRITIFVDYDGTLVPICLRPEDAVLSDESKTLLRNLVSYPWLDIVVVSGRDSKFLQEQFREFPIHLASEHGAKSYDPTNGRWRRHVHRSRADWYPDALKIMKDYADRVPGSRVEKKQYAIAWHYRLAPPEYGDLQSKKLAEELEIGLANLPVSIIRGKKVIEARAIEADKGVFARSFLEASPAHTGSLVIGDDATDEDIFKAIRGRGISIRIGPGPSAADFALLSQADVLVFLLKLATALEEKMGLSTNLPSALLPSASEPMAVWKDGTTA